MPFEFQKTSIEGLILVKAKVIGDERGFFVEEYKKSDFLNAGIDCDFVQDNHSLSAEGVLRGLHYQKEPFSQAKLVRCLRGKIWDVAVDLRRNSNTYGKWEAFELSQENAHSLFIPENFAHGFLVLSKEAEIFYKCSKEYKPDYDAGIRFDDSQINVKWPQKKYIISQKDLNLPYSDTGSE